MKQAHTNEVKGHSTITTVVVGERVSKDTMDGCVKVNAAALPVSAFGTTGVSLSQSNASICLTAAENKPALQSNYCFNYSFSQTISAVKLWLEEDVGVCSVATVGRPITGPEVQFDVVDFPLDLFF